MSNFYNLKRKKYPICVTFYFVGNVSHLNTAGSAEYDSWLCLRKWMTLTMT